MSDFNPSKEEPKNWNKELYKACMDGNTKAFQEAIENGADINYIIDKKSILIHATEKGNTEMVRLLLLQENPKVDVNYVFTKGQFKDIWQSALYVACREGNTEIVKLLLEHDADTNLTYYGARPISAAIIGGQIDVVEVFLKKKKFEEGDVINAKAYQDGNTTLHRAILNNNYELVKALLGVGAEINIPSGKNREEQGPTALELVNSNSENVDPRIFQIINIKRLKDLLVSVKSNSKEEQEELIQLIKWNIHSMSEEDLQVTLELHRGVLGDKYIHELERGNGDQGVLEVHKILREEIAERDKKSVKEFVAPIEKQRVEHEKQEGVAKSLEKRKQGIARAREKAKQQQVERGRQDAKTAREQKTDREQVNRTHQKPKPDEMVAKKETPMKPSKTSPPQSKKPKSKR